MASLSSVPKKRLPNRMHIAIVGSVAKSIERGQIARPGFNQDILDSLVNVELRKLEKEMGMGLDEVAEGADRG